MTKPSISLETAVNELLQANTQLTRRLRNESAIHELTWSQLFALGRLCNSGPSTTADLARAESVKPQSMGATLAVLEERGMIARKAHPSDGRQVLFEVTPAGMALRAQVGNAKRAWLTGAMAQLNHEEQQTLIDAIGLLRRLSSAP